MSPGCEFLSWQSLPVSIHKGGAWPAVFAETIAAHVKGEVRKDTGVVALNLPRGPGFAVSLDSSLDSTCVVGCMQGVFSGFPRWACFRCNKGGLVSVGYR